MKVFNRLFLILAAFVLVYSWGLVGAVDSRTVDVYVTNVSNSPVAGAHVVATVQSTGKIVDLGLTGSNGYTAKHEFDLGTYLTLEASASGYDSVTQRNLLVFFLPTFEIQLLGGGSGTSYGASYVVDEKLVADQQCPSAYVEQGNFVDSIGAVYRICLQKVYGAFQQGTYVNFSYFEPDTGAAICVKGGTSVGTFRYGYASDAFTRLCVSKDNINQQEVDGVSPIVLDVVADGTCYTNSAYNLVSGPIYLPSGGVVYHCAKVLNWDESDGGDCKISNPRWITPDGESFIVSSDNVIGPIDGTEVGRLPGDKIHLAVDVENCLEDTIIFEVYKGRNTNIWGVQSPITFTSTHPTGSFAYNVPAWEPSWVQDTTPGAAEDEPIYYSFIAKVQGTGSVLNHSAFLQVNRPPEKECDDLSDCAEGEICDEFGACIIECATDDDCSEGRVCCDDKALCTVGKCVECFEDDDCATLFGEDYLCIDNLCANNGPCELSEPFWLSEDGKLITGGEIKGWGDDAEKKDGVIVRLTAKGEGNCVREDVVFNIYEENVGVDTLVTQLTSTDSFDTNFFVDEWRPPWDISGWQKTVRGSKLKYYFVVKNGLERSGKSPILTVVDSGEAECNEDVAEGEDDECKDDKICSGGSCISECSADSDCAAGLSCNQKNGRCVGCLDDSQCSDDKKCNPNTFACVQCYEESHCPAQNETCDMNAGTCVLSCESDSDCTTDPERGICDTSANKCVQCLSNKNCEQEGKNLCNANGDCVRCLQDSDCGFLRSCDKENNICYDSGVDGFLDGGGGALAVGAIGAVIGFMFFGGPIGAIVGGIIGALVGGAGGGLLGGLF